jgi:L-threonylcarbamoyladenylate synthase
MPEDPSEYERIEILSANGDLREAAANLFAIMRKLDEAGLEAIVAERMPDQGLGRAINDRLLKASRKIEQGD